MFGNGEFDICGRKGSVSVPIPPEPMLPSACSSLQLELLSILKKNEFFFIFYNLIIIFKFKIFF